MLFRSRAAYTDRGAGASPVLTAERSVILKAPSLSPEKADVISNASLKKSTMFIVAQNVIPVHNGHIAFKAIDLTGVKKLELTASANPREGVSGGTIEIRVGGPDGTLIGSVKIEPVDPFKAMMSQAQAAQDNGGKGSKKPSAPPQAKPKKQPFFDFAALMRRPGIPVEIKPTEGMQDLYLVFRNDKVSPKQPLMSLSRIGLNNK